MPPLLYLVMEFVDGGDLEQYTMSHGRAGIPEGCDWIRQAACGLQEAHDHHLIHRDMKPSNVMVTKDNQIKLIDFGIARIFKSTAKKDTSLLGSQGYAPLEQYGRSQSDPRSDIYALGATLYDLLTNSVPADAPSRRINPQVFETPRQINPNISQATEEIVLRAMAEEPQNRFQSAEEMREAILMSGVVSTSSGFYSSATLPNTVPSQPFVPRPPTPRGTTVPQQAQTIISGGTAGSRSAPNLRGQPSQPPASAGPSAAPMTPVYPQAPIPGSPSPGRRGVSRRGLLIAGAAGVVVVALGGTGLYLATRGGGGSGAPPPLTGPSITVNFTYSTEKADWLTAAISAFNKSGTSLNGKVVQVALDPRGSGEAKDGILNGAIQPTAWSPASSLELSQLSGAWQLAHQGKDVIGSGDLLPKSLVFSPLVFAVWEERAKVLLNKYHTIDWPGIHEALILKNGWADIGGDATWGLVKFGQTRPDQSNSALLAITLLAYAYYKQERGLKVSQIQDPAFLQYFSDIEGAVNAFGRSSGTFLKNVVLVQGPAAYDITATYENLVLTLENEARTRQRQVLQPYYPGLNILSDHPFAILQGDWVKPEEQQAALLLRDFLLADEQQRLALKSGFRPTSPNVPLTANIPGNVFAQQSARLHIPPTISPLAQVPGGGVIDELIKQWKSKYGDTQVTPGG